MKYIQFLKIVEKNLNRSTIKNIYKKKLSFVHEIHGTLYVVFRSKYLNIWHLKKKKKSTWSDFLPLFYKFVDWSINVH